MMQVEAPIHCHYRLFVLLALVASIFPYLNSTDNTVTSNTPSSLKADKDKKINKEYKINQDDKDSVVRLPVRPRRLK
jgi:hypothetical protein